MIIFTSDMIIVTIIIIIGCFMDHFRLKKTNYKLGEPIMGKMTITGLYMLLFTSSVFLVYIIVYLCLS